MLEEPTTAESGPAMKRYYLATVSAENGTFITNFYNYCTTSKLRTVRGLLTCLLENEFISYSHIRGKFGDDDDYDDYVRFVSTIDNASGSDHNITITLVEEYMNHLSASDFSLSELTRKIRECIRRERKDPLASCGYGFKLEEIIIDDTPDPLDHVGLL
jgi:hypothetical protein